MTHPSVERLLGQVQALREELRVALAAAEFAAQGCDYWFHKAKKYGRHLEGCAATPELQPAGGGLCTCGFTDEHVVASTEHGT